MSQVWPLTSRGRTVKGENPFEKQSTIKVISANNRSMYREEPTLKATVVTSFPEQQPLEELEEIFLIFPRKAPPQTKTPCQDPPAMMEACILMP